MTAGAWVIATAVYLILAYFGGLAALRLLVALAGSRQRARLLAALRLVDHANVSLAKSMPPLSLAILPGRNPAALYETISTAVTLEYPGLEIIVVLDAGRADIFGPLIPAFELSRAYRVYKHPVRHERIRAVYASTRFPQLLLIDKPEGDPADDLNAALNVANAPFFMFIEAGTRLNPQSLRALFLTWSQAPETTAIGIAPSRIRPIVASAVMETATQEFPLSTDWSWATLASSLCGTNALAVYRKKSLELVGGFSIRARNPRVDTPIRLIEKLRRLGIMAGTVFCPVPIASESCPGTVDLIRRHQAGMLDALSHHGGEAMSSGSLGTAGAIVYLVLFEAARPVIESAAFLFLYIAALQGWVDPTTLLMTIAVILAALVMGTGFGTFSQAGFAETDATGSGTPGRLLATVLSPLGAHPVALWGRLLGLMDHLTLPPKKIRTPTVAAAADQSQARPSTSVIAVQPDLPTPTHPAPPPLAWAATGLRSRHAPPPPAPAVEEAPVEVEPSPAPAPTTAPKPPEKGRSKRRGSSKRAPAPQPASSETEPITFDVTTHYQIKANVPKGTTPSVQVPTAPGSPIIVTTGASAPKDAPAPAAPTEPPAPGTPARGRRIAEVPDLPPAEEKKPDEVPVSAIEAQLSALEEAVTDEAAPSGESSVILPETETGSSAEEPIDLSTVSTTGDTRMRESSIIDMPPVGGDDPAEPLELTVLEEEAADVTREVGAQITFRPLGPQEAPVVLGALAKSYVFASIPPQQRHELLPFFVVGKAEAQQELLREGQQVRALFLVCSGDLDAAGPQVPRFTLSTGATFGMTSLKPLPSFGLSVRAKSPAAIAAIRAGDLTRLSKLFPSLNLGAHDTTLAVSIPSEASLPNPAGESSVVLPLAQSESPLEEPLDLSAVSTTGETRKQESSMEMPPLQGVDLSEPLELGAIDDETVAEITREVGALIPFKLPTPQHEPRILEAMAKSPFFAPVRAKRLHELLPFFVVGEAKAQQVILREGQPVQALFMILSGDLEAAGRSVPRFVLGSGRTFGMISTKPVPFFDLMVRARTPVELAAIRAKDLVRLADQFPGLNLKAHETTMAVSIPVRSPGRPASAGRSVPQATGPSVRLTCGEMPLRPVSPEEAHRVLTAIAHSPIFCLLKPSDYDRLLPYFSLINVKKGATILSKGGPPTALFMLVAGQARIVGETFVLGPGQCFGAISTNPPAKFGSTIEATADCILAVIRSESIRQIANKFPDLGLASDESSIHMPMESSGIESITAEPIDLDNIAVVAKQAVTRPAARLPFVPVDEDTAPGLLKALARSPLFGGLTATQRSTLVSSFRITSTTEGAEIVREGEENRALFLVVEGRVRILSRDGQGAERSLAALEAGETFGEMSILTREPAGASVRADVDSWIATLTEKQFLKLCEATPGLAATLARIIAQRLARTSADIVNDLKKGIFGRLELIPPGALVQAITVNAQTGLLVVQSGRQSFTGYFQDGQLYDASTQELEGEEAFYDFLHWTSGSFRLEPERRTGAQRRITTDTMGLLLEGMRQLDEQRHASGELPAIPAAKRSEPSSKVRIEPFALADTEAAAKALSRIPLFSGLSAEQVRGVLSLAQEMEAQRGDCVIRQGQEGKALYIAASGAYDVVRTSDQGREETIASLGPGDCFGEISVITGDRATATVVVREEGTLLVIPREELSPLLARLPALGASLARILAARLARTGRWLREEEQRVIMGRVESMSIPELVQALNVNRQSGTLVVQRASKTVEVDFIDGEIQDVRLGSLTGEIAFLILLAWTTGSFRFKPDRPETAVRTVNRDTVGLLFRGLRILERARQKHDQVA